MSEINYIDELTEGIFPVNLKIIDGKTPSYWLKIELLNTKAFFFVEKVIIISTLKHVRTKL